MTFAKPRRTLLPLGVLLLAGCGSGPSPDEPALAAATGIPMGAPNAAGVSFDGASAPPAVADEADLGMPPHTTPLPKALPPDPFDPMEHPPGPSGSSPGLKIKPPKKKGMQL